MKRSQAIIDIIWGIVHIYTGGRQQQFYTFAVAFFGSTTKRSIAIIIGFIHINTGGRQQEFHAFAVAILGSPRKRSMAIHIIYVHINNGGRPTNRSIATPSDFVHINTGGRQQEFHAFAVASLCSPTKRSIARITICFIHGNTGLNQKANLLLITDSNSLAHRCKSKGYALLFQLLNGNFLGGGRRFFFIGAGGKGKSRSTDKNAGGTTIRKQLLIHTKN